MGEASITPRGWYSDPHEPTEGVLPRGLRRVGSARLALVGAICPALGLVDGLVGIGLGHAIAAIVVSSALLVLTALLLVVGGLALNLLAQSGG